MRKMRFPRAAGDTMCSSNALQRQWEEAQATSHDLALARIDFVAVIENLLAGF